MLTDVHSICGYMIAKFFYEYAFQSRQRSINPLQQQQQQQQQLQQRVGTTIIYSGKFSKMISRNVKWLTSSGSAAVAQRPMLKRFIRYVLNSRFFDWFVRIKDYFINLPFERKYQLVGIILGNLPDFDVLFSKFFGGYALFHRTWTHSLIGNCAIVPSVAYIVQRYMGDTGMASYRHYLLLSAACVASHIFTDYITNYGTGVLFPWSKKLYSLGVITIWDFTTVIFFYMWFTVSRSNRISQYNSMLYGCISFAMLLMWKRAMLQEAYSKAHHTMQHEANKNKNVQLWLQPCNFWNGKYHLLMYNEKKQSTVELKQSPLQTSKLLSLVQFVLELFGKQRDVRKAFIASEMLMPREFFSFNLYKENPNLFWHLVKHSLPTVMFICCYHATYWVWNKFK